jgi:polar amino acid transport system substrate-binding protein
VLADQPSSKGNNVVPKKLIAAAGIIALAGALVSCSSGSSDSGDGGEQPASNPALKGELNPDAPLFDQLPASVQEAGVLTNGADMTFPPFEFFDEDGVTVVGLEVDLGLALSEELGVPIEWVSGSTENGLLGVESGRYDIAFMAVNRTEERQEKYDFVNYMQSSSSFVGMPETIANVKSESDLCSLTIAGTRGTAPLGYAEELLAACGDEGGEILAVDTDSSALLAVKQGKADVIVANTGVLAYALTQPGGEGMEMAEGIQVGVRQYGIVLQKGNTELAEVLKQAFQNIIDNGAYAQVLADWDMADSAIDAPSINGDFN